MKSHYQDFMKRLRWHYPNDTIRYFHCGEYGERLQRPHYHACLFGWDFEDKKLYKQLEDGSRLCTSEALEKIWGHGFCTVGDVTFESAAYVARYVTKKVTGEKAEDHYWHLDEATGEMHKITPEYVTMSRRPGIASEWYRRYGKEVATHDQVIVGSVPRQPPKFYDRLFEAAHGTENLEKIKKERLKRARKHAENQTPERLRVREICAERRRQLLHRGLEDETQDIRGL